VDARTEWINASIVRIVRAEDKKGIDFPTKVSLVLKKGKRKGRQ